MNRERKMFLRSFYSGSSMFVYSFNYTLFTLPSVGYQYVINAIVTKLQRIPILQRRTPTEQCFGKCLFELAKFRFCLLSAFPSTCTEDHSTSHHISEDNEIDDSHEPKHILLLTMSPSAILDLSHPQNVRLNYSM